MSKVECHDKLEWKKGFLGDIETDYAVCDECETTYVRKSGSDIIYAQKKGEKGWNCLGCNSKIQRKEQGRPIWWKGWPCAGPGRVKSVTIPYCPNCEREPSSRGLPIEV